MDRDQADGLFARQRSQPLLDLARCEAKTARAYQVDADQIAVLGAAAIGLGDIEFAAGLLLVHRHQPSATTGQRSKDSKHAGLGVIDYLDDAAVISAALGVRFLE